MHSHFYKAVKTARHIAEVEGNRVPNQHTVVHGLIVYKTLQSSFNTLIITELLFSSNTTVRAT